MTQAELPQLSLRRYIDLVKRRRWRVVPVSLLGLLIGGLVAFFIPRFYVAETLLTHSQLPGVAEDTQHPFKQIVDTAKSSLPLYAEDAIRELNWPEYASGDLFTQQQFVRTVESRIEIFEQNGGDRTRGYAKLRVEYRDTDGKRSEQLLNRLVEVWKRQRMIELREPARQRSREAKKKAERALQTVRQCRNDKESLQRQYGIHPEFKLDAQRQEYRKEIERLGEERKALNQLKGEHDTLAAEIKIDEAKLVDTLPRVKPIDALWVEAAMEDENIAPLAISAARMRMAYETTFNPGTNAWFKAKRDYDFLVVQIKQMLPKVPVDADGLIPNPDHTKLRVAIEAAKKKLLKLSTKIESYKKAAEQRAKDLSRLKDGYPIYENKLSELKEAEKAREDALEDETEANRVDAQLTQDLPIKVLRPALVPPAPTEPNIMVVASSGCALGLLAAIALILLFDFLQGSYKTIEDVERGLSVPVLGGVSHLETEIERHVASRSRRRISLVAAAALLMVTAIVTVFYLDPNRLPEVVRKILNVLLVDS